MSFGGIVILSLIRKISRRITNLIALSSTELTEYIPKKTESLEQKKQFEEPQVVWP
jgi:hypothetical protein